MSPTDGTHLDCAKRQQRLSVSVCLFRKCPHLREGVGVFFYKFVSEEEKKAEKRKKK